MTKIAIINSASVFLKTDLSYGTEELKNDPLQMSNF